MTAPYDTDFSHAVMKAAAQGDPGDLADLLRSNRLLGAGERELLALLVTGQLKPFTGGRLKGSTKLSGKQQREIASEYDMRVKLGEKSDAIIADLCTTYPACKTTIRNAIRANRDGSPPSLKGS